MLICVTMILCKLSIDNTDAILWQIRLEWYFKKDRILKNIYCKSASKKTFINDITQLIWVAKAEGSKL